ncbi:hypothetical protein F2Q69_00039590 [Brassica cretica]|uniref:UBX domain-containing protein n=1 Tax=Brassica cretica TaxID=69181 RepID=A0A8S9NJA9_BRACR|nr:hypothetical protein F2Q69_00039590 [Brassica cretica]
MSSTSSSHPQTITVLWQLRKKAVIRVRFPDNHTLEATFHPSEKLQSLADLLKRALAHTHKHVQLLPRSRSRISHKTSTLLGSFLELFSTWQTIYQKASLASIPSHDDAAISSPYLNEEMKDVEAIIKEAEPVEPSSEPVTTVPVDQNPRRRRRPQSLSGLKCD